MNARRTGPPPDRGELLEDLSRFASSGAAEVGPEQNFFKEHLPIAEHRRVLDRETLLVLGGRGTGKTQLFNALSKATNPRDVITSAPSKTRSEKADCYIQGYTITGTKFPPPDILEKVCSGDSAASLRRLWFGLLAGALINREPTRIILQEHLNEGVHTSLSQHLAAPSNWLQLVDTHFENMREALDRVDEKLARAQQSVVVIYDDLDRLAARMADVYPLIRELLAFWLDNSRRWNHVRCKIFLRTDIFNAEDVSFTDSSKLRPLSVTLRWGADNLYRLVLKRIVNRAQRDKWFAFLAPRVSVRKFRRHPTWAYVPETDEADHRAFMELVVGKWMGSDKRRGDTYRWFLNHLQDSLGNIVPRSFLKLFECSALRQLQAGVPSTTHLLVPEQIAGALAEVSTDRITELKEEYGWLDEIGRRLKGQTVPMERAEFRECSRVVTWNKLPDTLRQDTDRLIDYLISLGILRETADKRIHVPDIYLFGFDLRRKGGIRRPRV